MPGTDHPITERRALKLLRELVLIPSSSQDDKKEIIERVIRLLEGWGFRCEVMGEADSPALLASFGEGGLLFSGHLDTVPLGDGWTAKQGELRGSILFGRGTADMKGGCAAMLLAAEELAKSRIPMSIAFTTDEETKMKGAEFIAGHELAESAPAVIVCEPTLVGIGAREKGLLQIRVSTTGKSAHAAMPQEGENAVHKMIAALERLRSMMAVPENPMESITLSIGVLRGGEKVNVIPDSCVAEIDIRTPANVLPQEALEMVMGKLNGMDLEMRVMNQLRPIMTNEDSMIIKQIAKLRPGIKTIDIAYATELVKYLGRNANLLAIGPGDPKQAHVPNEHIELHQVAEAAELYRELCASMTK